MRPVARRLAFFFNEGLPELLWLFPLEFFVVAFNLLVIRLSDLLLDLFAPILPVLDSETFELLSEVFNFPLSDIIKFDISEAWLCDQINVFGRFHACNPLPP